MNKITSISTSSTKQIESLLASICKQSNLDNRMLSMYLSTGGLHYTIEHIAAELFLNKKIINKNIRSTLQLICIGANTKHEYSDLFRANERFATIDPKSWQYDSELKKIQHHRQLFITKGKLCL